MLGKYVSFICVFIMPSTISSRQGIISMCKNNEYYDRSLWHYCRGWIETKSLYGGIGEKVVAVIHERFTVEVGMELTD